jgi:hypothetical protein
VDGSRVAEIEPCGNHRLRAESSVHGGRPSQFQSGGRASLAQVAVMRVRSQHLRQAQIPWIFGAIFVIWPQFRRTVLLPISV